MVETQNEELKKMYLCGKRRMQEKYPHLNWDLKRFDIPFNKLATQGLTPDDAWLYGTFFIEPDYERSASYENSQVILVNPPRTTHKIRKGMCTDRSVSVYSLIDKIFRPQLIYLTGGEQAHSMTVFQQGNKWGSLSNSVLEKYGKREAEHDRLIDLLQSYPWFRYAIVNLEELFPDTFFQEQPIQYQFKSTHDVRELPNPANLLL